MRLSKPDHVVAETLDDETVLVNLRSNRIFELNRTASRIWAMIGEELSTDEIQTRLREEFAASEDEVNEDLDELVDFLEQEALVVAAEN